MFIGTFGNIIIMNSTTLILTLKKHICIQVLGGSSSTNVCLHHRGSATDYNEWGIRGWTAADVLPYFKLTQKDNTGRNPEFHGKEGLWVMDEVRYQNPLSKRFIEVGAAAGLGINNDFNDWSRIQDGCGRFQVSQQKGERCSGATAFISIAKKRKNVTVRTGTMVRKINFDDTKNAKGVTYDLMGDDTCRVSAVCHVSPFLLNPVQTLNQRFWHYRRSPRPYALVVKSL